MLKALQKEGRQATVAEQRTLSLYTGWGSLGEQLFNDQNPDWAEERAELKGLLTEAEYASARRTVQYAHYTPMDVVRGMYDALGLMGVRGANLSAYEAGLGVGRFIGGLPEGLRGTRYTGVEMDPLTAAIAAQLYPQATVVNEKYQDVPAPHGQFDFIVGNPPYGNIKLSDRSFPDGNGQSLHNFFIMKQIEALRPGGVAAFLVTHYFLDAQDQSARLWIHQRAQFLGAIRMPNALFKTVDASLATDIVFFRKRLPGEAVPSVVGERKKKGKKRDDEETGVAAIPRESQWVYTDTVTQLGRDENNKNPDGLPLRINMAFSPNRTVYDMRAVYYSPGDTQAGAWPSVMASTRYGKDRPQADLVVHGPAPTREGIYNTLTHMPIRTFLTGVFQPYTERVLTEQEVRERLSTTQAAKLGGGAAHPSLLAGGHFVGADGKLYYTTKRFDGQLVAWPVKPYDEAAEKAAYATNPRMTQAKKGKPARPAPFKRWKDVRDPYTKFTPQEQGIMKTIAALREVRFDLMQEELSENADEARLTELRKRLNEAYADFQKAATGYAGTKRRPPALNDREIKALMFADPASSQLLGLETLKKDKSGEIEEVVKGAVFFRRVNEPKWRPLEHYDKAMDALVANLSETGAIDLDWIMARTGKGREAVLDELRERVYIDPETERPVLREQYLSGDVKTKWEVAKQAVAEGKTEYARNVEALGTVIPADIAIEDLYVPFGSSIVTGEMVGRFAQSEMGFVHRDDVKATFNTQTGTWEVDVKNVPKDLYGRYFVANRSFKDVMKAALNNKGLTVYEKDEAGNSHPNKEATEQVAETIRQIRDQWEMWWPSSPFAAEIGKTYNARYNRIAEAQYDGAFLKFQGLNPALTPYRHQRDAVWRTVVTGNVLYNHVVGSGKTNTAILSIMEMKRMGRVRKPVVVVPNHLVEQWRNDFLAAYPGANVLATDVSDLSAENRKRYFARIQNGDYDVIILPHSQLSRISLSPDVLKELVARQIAKYREALEELVRNGAERYTIKRIENMIERMEARIDAKIKALRTDETGIFFDTPGIDGLFLDEAHEFKNVPFVSAVQAKGMGNPSGSSKAFDLLMKVNWMRQKRAGAPVVFMTGTPVSNSLTELYLNMLYMAPDLLEKAKLNSMDAFLQSFGLVDERMEVATTGQFKVARRLRKLMNVPELMRMVRTYMDVIDADDLRGSMEAVGRAYDVPELETGAPINVVAKRSPLQEIYFGKEVAKRQKADGSFEREFNVGSIYYRAGHMPQDPSEDNMLKLTNDAMAASLDIRLRKRELIAMGVPESELTDEALDFAGSKVNLCVAQIVKDYKRFDAVKGTQMVFCDRSIPGSARSSIAKDLEKKRKELETARKAAEREELDPTAGFRQRDEDEESPAEKVAKLEREVRALEQELESGFSVYDDIKRKLVAQGIPAEEIAFIHDYETKEKKQALFDRMNAGKVRVLLGSTSRMGAGTNANKRMVSMHHLDAPWRPSDMEQRNGRIIRQGNLLMKEIPDFKVRVYQYGTEKSADAFKFSTLLEKGRAFHGIYKRTNTTRNVEEIGDGEMSSEQMMAQLSGSLLMPLMIEQREGVQTLERQARNHNAKRRNLVDARDNTDAQTPIIQDNLARARRVTELATERPDTKENYYAGIDLRDRDGNPIALNAKTMRERLDEQHGEPIAKLLHLGATIRYRGLEWVSTRRTSQTGDLFDVYEEVKAYAPNDASAERRPLVMTTQYDVNGAKDDAIIIRMNNAIDKARQSIPIFERQLKANAEELAKLDRQLAEYPEAFPKNQELLEAKREFADIERCVNADATTAAEARVTLGHYYGQKGLPVPDYTWTRPEFDEKHGVKPNAQPSGMLRETAASVPFGELERWNQNLDAYENHRLSLNKPVVVLRQTPEIIRRAIALAGDERFAKDKPITIRVENLDKITGMDVYTLTGKHKVPMDELRKLQLELDNPVAIFVSRTRPDTSIVVVTELMDKQDNAKAIIALQYARHPNGDYATLVPMNANVLSSVYGKRNIGDVRDLLYVNTEKARAWEGASRLQLPFARVILANAQGLSGVLTERDFSMDDKGKVLKNGRLVNPEDLGRLREPKWERELRERLAREGKTEADLSPETQAYLNAKREREAVMPKGAFGQASDFLGEAVRPREDETHWEFAKRKGKAFAEFVSKRFIDVRAPLIAAQREIAGAGLSDNEDVAKAMSLSYGRIVSRHADIDHAFVEPAMQLLADNGVGVSDLDIYLQATFAPERNKMIAERAEWKDAGAGITDEEAEKRLRGMRERLSPAQFRAVEEAARHIWKMNRENLRRLAESGILSADQVAEWLRLSPHYVPLRDDLERLGVEEPGAGGKLRKEGPFRKAVGRYSEALDSSVGWSVIQAKQGVIWAEQNRIARITLNFALNHKNPDDYYVSQVPRSAERVFRVRKGYRQEDAVPLRLDRPTEKDLAQQYLKAGYTVVRSKENPNIVWVDGGEMDKVLRVRRGSDSRRTNLPQNVVARVGGRRVYIFFNDIAGTRGNKMGLAINRANLVQWNNRWWNGVEWVTRVKAMLSTVWSPTFAITNAISDIMQTTGIMTTEGKGKILFDVYRNYTPALREVAKWRKGGKFDDTTEMGRWLEEAVRTGVLTGLRNNYMNFDQQMLDSVLRPLRQMERRGETWAGDPLAKLAYYGANAQQLAQLISEVPEVGIRLAVYSALRKHGWGASDAALYAREITVDFNRKGEWTPVLNVLYMFSNAGIQSAARWWKALKEGTWGSRARGVLLFAIMGFVSQLWNRVASQLFGDDDDAYRNIPEWAWERSIPVVLPGGIQLNIPNRGMQAAFTLIGKDAADLLVGDIMQIVHRNRPSGKAARPPCLLVRPEGKDLNDLKDTKDQKGNRGGSAATPKWISRRCGETQPLTLGGSAADGGSGRGGLGKGEGCEGTGDTAPSCPGRVQGTLHPQTPLQPKCFVSVVIVPSVFSSYFVSPVTSHPCRGGQHRAYRCRARSG